MAITDRYHILRALADGEECHGYALMEAVEAVTNGKVILAFSGALAPQGRLLGRLLLSYAKREAGRRGLTWRGRFFRALARRLELATSEKAKDKGKTDDRQR